MHRPRKIGDARPRVRPGWRATSAALTAALVVSVLAACSGLAAGIAPTASPRPSVSRARHVPAPAVARTRAPSQAVTELTQTAPATLTAAFARTIFATSPIVVVASADGPVPAAAARATHAPLLLTAGITAQFAAQVRALRPRVVLADGLPASERRELAARLRGIRVVSKAAQLPRTGTPVPLTGLAVLLPPGPGPGAVLAAITATAQAAGAAVIGMTSTDPRADPAAIVALASQRPSSVVAVGAAFGPVPQLSARLAVAETGTQLPGGGQVLFPGRMLVALYGHPGTPGLGVLGQQDLPASIARARQMAAAYQPLSKVPVIPAFEIIATVAEASAGPDGTYSYETPVADLLPWVKQATAAGLYVVLDLQAGRASLLAQAEQYQSLLELSDVGLAIDPEWKLEPDQLPLRQIGHVDISQVNSVIQWLAALTARYDLPQKLLVLHQFQLSMIVGEQDLDTHEDDLSIIIHMDGQGTPAEKEATWDAITAAAPPGVHFGWKNFFVMDHPMLTPQQTMAAAVPTPVMISYQ